MPTHHRSAIATRRYYHSDDEAIQVILTFDLPVQSEPGFFRCAYHFEGDRDIHHEGPGLDEVHALVTALEMASTELYLMNERDYGGKLVWEGGPARIGLLNGLSSAVNPNN